MKNRKIKTAALILNGRYLPPKIEADYVLCADGGYNLAKKAGLRCDAVIGDMDSAQGLEPGIKTLLFEREKDETDGQLAALHLTRTGFERINIYGALGGRPDHAAANVNLLAFVCGQGAEAVILDEGVKICFVSDALDAECAAGDTVSVLPYTDTVTFAGSRGLLYPLDGLEIEKHSSRGVSNKATENRVSIRVKSGKAFVYILKA